MRVDIVDCNIVTGGGKTYLEDSSVIIQDGLITETPRIRHIPYNFYTDRIIDAAGDLLIPGMINIHSHCLSFGPILTYAHHPIPEQRVLGNLNKHMLQGETTIVNSDGFCLPHEVEATNKIHPMNIKFTTNHMPKNIAASELIIGRELSKWHKEFTPKEAIENGAVAIGEIGCPATTCGTFEKRLRLGKDISAQEARALDNAYIAKDDKGLRQAMDAIGLEEMPLDDGKKMVNETSFLPIQACNDSIDESVEYSQKTGLPVLVHSEPGSKEALLRAAKELGPKCIAVHINHTFNNKESVALGKELRKLGAVLEIITADPFNAKQIESTPENHFALLKEGLVDVITTDYSGGYADAMLLLMQKAIEAGVVDLPKAISLGTSMPAQAMPKVAPYRGLIEPGKVADLVIVDKNDILKVKYVIIAGRVVVEEGRLVYDVKPF